MSAPTIRDTVLAVLERRVNRWLTPDEIAEATAEWAAPAPLTRQQVRGALGILRGKRLVLCSLDSPWLGKAPGGTWRSLAGFMAASRFEARGLPTAIFIGEEPITGPFCVHCGNPSYVHGTEGECLNYRIHPLLPPGDLPRPR